MSYIGSNPITQSFISGTDYFNGDGSTVAFTLSRAVGSVNDISVLVNNVTQQPNTVYTVLGTTLTFTTAPSSGTQNIYVRYLSTTTQAIVPSQGTVNTAQLGLITTIPTTGGNVITLPASTGTVALTSQLTTFTAPQVTALTSGSGTYTVPANAKYLTVRMIGGGGNGGTGVSGVGGGGGAGGYLEKLITSPSATYSYAVGATGSATTFGAGLTANGGSAGSVSTVSSAGGAGGTATGGDLNIVGSYGMYGWAAAPYYVGGKGSATPFGDGGSGGGTNSGAGYTASSTCYGAGGGGGVGGGGGGLGCGGVIIVTAYFG